MIGIESVAHARLAIAREIAAERRAQFLRHRAQPKPAAAPKAQAAFRSSRRRIRSASRV